MPTRVCLLLVVTSVLSACDLGQAGRDVGECVGSAIGSAIGTALGVGLAEGNQPVGRPDEVRGPAGNVTVSGSDGDGGRLVLVLGGPVLEGALPRSAADGGCSLESGVFRYDPQQGAHVLFGTLTVGDGGVAEDGGALTELSLTHLAQEQDGGGPLPDRRFVVALP